MFTGDRSGDFLYAALWRAGLASQPTSRSRGDGLALRGAWITAAVRCAPPANRPAPQERDRCLPFAQRELELLRDVRVDPLPRGVRVGGGAAHRRARAPRRARASATAPSSTPAPRRRCSASYHPSQQNTFTGRLTEAMLDAVLARAVELAGPTRYSRGDARAEAGL